MTLLPWVVRSAGLMAGVALALATVLGGAAPAFAQLAPPVGVDQLIFTEQLATPSPFPDTPYTTPCDPNSFNGCDDPQAVTDLTFGAENNVVLNAVIAAGTRFEPATDLLPPVGLAQQIVFRRNVDADLPNRQLLFFEQTTVTPDALTLAPGQVAGIEEAMLSNIINRGIDNVFNNVPEVAPEQNGQETANNIERIDYIITAPGILVPVADQGNVGFLILERGGNDAFKIAAITALDGNGAPAAYGPLINISTANWGASNDVQVASAVMRWDDLNDSTPPLFRPSHVVGAQPVRGIFFPINSLVTAPDNANPIFGYSLFAVDVNGSGAQLVNFFDTTVFPTNTTGANAVGGLDLIAGGFGLIRRTGGFSLVKRVTDLLGPATLPDFSQVLGAGRDIDLLRNNNLGQGQITIADPPVQTGNGIEYTIYLTNTDTIGVTGVVVCDQIPAGTTFNPDGYGPGLGIEAIASSSPPGPAVTYTSADDGDPGTFFPPGAALPAVCGANQNNGAVVVTVGPVNANQVGLIRFQTTVN
ncbi:MULTISPECIES: DUF11 domain-containing protein [Cyanophyceae]|uniref:DUF11 domain-containing protein n=1 Tax=Leptolyngbya subtilissima DQ-A4 TaxID=2933933 RepID=A0ABV0JZU3_9CYAN|nr:DUF11 domain-containing protein [Nodosilinea sp. FACHB-141]MBD2110436.1 DUF11 domain-containing protein [Nodosilinea sp. FACHB-141]